MKAWRNKFNNYRFEDLLLDESFIDWIYQGKAQSNAWAARIAENPELAGQAEKAERILQRLRPSDAAADYRRIEELKDRIDAKIEAIRIQDEFGRYHSDRRPGDRRSGNRRNSKYRPFRYVGIAACLAALITAIFVMELPSNNELPAGPNTAETRSTKNGQKLTVHLSDGSKVKLNSGSSIKYDKYFSDVARIIHLEGEAFFEVAKDSLRPFIVYAGNTATRALGTSFNIRSESDRSAQISLVTGKVVVTNTLNNEYVRLMPGSRIISRNGELGAIESFDYAEIAWKDDILVFRNVSGAEVFKTLEKWYGVSFKLDKRLRGLGLWNYTGEFDNESLQNVLTSIGYAEKFTFSIQNKEVVIKPMEH